ncbi:hypothetical protein ACW9YV_15430 (plasmid) [Paraburkholderia strydomiana]
MRNGIETANDFLRVIVEEDVKDAIANPQSVRLIMHALISLHQMNDWHFNDEPRQTSRKAHSKALYDDCAALKRVRDLATNAKHCLPYEDTPLERFGNTAIEATVITITSKAGAGEDLTAVMNAALKFWRSKLGSSSG